MSGFWKREQKEKPLDEKVLAEAKRNQQPIDNAIKACTALWEHMRLLPANVGSEMSQQAAGFNMGVSQTPAHDTLAQFVLTIRTVAQQQAMSAADLNQLKETIDEVKNYTVHDMYDGIDSQWTVTYQTLCNQLSNILIVEGLRVEEERCACCVMM